MTTAFPREIWSGVPFLSNEQFNLAYVAGSARLYSNAWPQPEGLPTDAENELSTSAGFVSGYEVMDGVLLPGDQHSFYIFFEVQPQFAAP